MTHDELLKKVETDQEITAYINAGLIKGEISINTGRQHWFQSNALRAVVELHKPYGSESKGFICEFCMNRALPAWVYPCPTIEAIENELK